MNPTPKPELDRIDATDPLARALRTAFADALAAAPKRHSKQTPQCVPLSRFVLVTQHGSALTDAERHHLTGCAFCSRNWNAFRAHEAEGPQPAPLPARRYEEPETARGVVLADETTALNFGASDETTYIEPARPKSPAPPPRPAAPDREDQRSRAPREAEPSEDELLVEGLRRRLPEAIERFYNEYYGRFLRVALRLVGDLHSAADLAHDAVLRVINKAETYKPEPGRAPRPWFMAVLRGTFLDWSRRRRLRQSVDLSAGSGDDGSDFELPAHEPTAHERAEAAEKVEAVQQAMLLLDPEERLLVTLRVYEEMSLPDLVEVMRAETGGRVATYGQVSGRLHQAKVRLRELLEEHRPDLFP